MNTHCPFERLIVAGTHACSRAIAVTRREGAGIDCNDADSCDRCGSLQEFFEQVGAEAFGEVEDRTQVAHSTLLKIQIGGLAGTVQCLDLSVGEKIEDLDQVAGQADGNLEKLDHEILIGAMRDARAWRRRSGGYLRFAPKTPR